MSSVFSYLLRFDFIGVWKFIIMNSRSALFFNAWRVESTDCTLSEFWSYFNICAEWLSWIPWDAKGVDKWSRVLFMFKSVDTFSAFWKSNTRGGGPGIGKGTVLPYRVPQPKRAVLPYQKPQAKLLLQKYRGFLIPRLFSQVIPQYRYFRKRIPNTFTNTVKIPWFSNAAAFLSGNIAIPLFSEIDTAYL